LTTPGGENDLLVKPEPPLDPLFVGCMLVDDVKQLDVGDYVDLRNVHGYYEIAEVVERAAADGQIKVHIPGRDDTWDMWLNCSQSNSADLRRIAKHKSVSRRSIYRERMKQIEIGYYCDINLSWIGLENTWVNGQVRMKCQYGSGQYQFVYFHPHTQQEQLLWIHVDNMQECAPYGSKTVFKEKMEKEEEKNEQILRIGKQKHVQKKLFQWFVEQKFGLPKYLEKFEKAEVFEVEMLLFIDEDFLEKKSGNG